MQWFAERDVVDTTRAAMMRGLLEGQFDAPFRVIEFTLGGTCAHDAAEEIAGKVAQRTVGEGLAIPPRRRSSATRGHLSDRGGVRESRRWSTDSFTRSKRLKANFSKPLVGFWTFFAKRRCPAQDFDTTYVAELLCETLSDVRSNTSYESGLQRPRRRDMSNLIPNGYPLPNVHG